MLEAEGTDEEAVAALLHDAVEDSKTEFEEIERRFGSEVRRIVAECTETLPKTVPSEAAAYFK